MRPFGGQITKTPAYLAPERQAELPSIFGDPPWELVFLDGTTNFKAVPSSNGSDPEIQVSYWALLSLWAVAKAAVIIVDAVYEAQALGEKTIPSEAGSAYRQACEYLQLCRDLTRNGNKPFPPTLAPPNSASTDREDIRVNNLFYGATGWVLLHEMGHIHLEHEIDVPSGLKIDQEYDADRWATKWVLPKNGILPQHYQFRILSLATAMLWIGIMNEVVGPSTTHPPAFHRLDQCRDLMDLGDDQTGLELGAYILKVAFLPTVDVGEFDSPAEAFDEVLFNYSRLQG